MTEGPFLIKGCSGGKPDALTNLVFGRNLPPYISISGKVFTTSSRSNIPENTLEMNELLRRFLEVTVDSSVLIDTFSPEKVIALGTEIYITLVLSSSHVTFEEDVLTTHITDCLQGRWIGNDRRPWLFSLDDCLFSSEIVNRVPGFFEKVSKIHLSEVASRKITLHRNLEHRLIKDIKVSDLGIGGLDDQIGYIFRRAFASRAYKKSTIERLGIMHVKGVILYGPPGTGKTLIARQLSNMLDCTSLQVISGPQILDKFVGGSEGKIRELFEPAEKDKGNGLHVIIFDEIDSICRSRSGDSGSGSQVQANIVNQLLAKMDGVEQLNNILIFGMTNRIELLDSALLRPGRFEVKVEVSLPNADGRRQIFSIHMAKMKANGFAEDMNLESLVKMTENFTGAEISGVVKNAVSFALEANVEGQEKDIKIRESDFLRAVSEIAPLFGRPLSLSLQAIDLPLPMESYLVMPNVYYVFSNDNTSEALGLSLASKLEAKTVMAIYNYDLVGADGFGKSRRIKDKVSSSLACESSVIVLVRTEEIVEYFAFNDHFNVQVAQTLRSILSYDYKKNIKFVVTTGNDTVKGILM